MNHYEQPMSLQFDPAKGKITYRGQEVGQQAFENGKSVVRINIEFETAGEWIVPVSWLAYGLALLPENQPPPVVLELHSPADSIEHEFDVVRYLTEKQVKRGGYTSKNFTRPMRTSGPLLCMDTNTTRD